MKTILKTILGASAVCAMFGTPNLAWGQRLDVFSEVRPHNVEIDRIKAEAETAQAAGNCTRYSILKNRLWEIRQNPKHPFWKRHGLDGPGTPGAVVTGLNQRMTDAVAYLNTLECPPRSAAAQPPKVEVQMGGGGQIVRQGNRSYLGTETGGVQRLGLVSPDREVSGGSVSGSLKYYLPYLVNSPLTLLSSGFFGIPISTWIKIHGFYSESKTNQLLGTIDPGAGNSLLILGTNGPATGFALGAHPLNVVRDARYSADLTKTGGRIDFGQATRIASDMVIDVFFSAGYTNVSYEEIFEASIPGFLRDFRYASDAKVDILTLLAGIQMARDFLIAEDVKLELGGLFELGPSFAWGNGKDSLAFTGFPTSSVNLSKSSTDLGLRVGLSAAVKFSNGFKFSVDGSYKRETGLPVFERPATNFSELQLKSGDAFIGMARLSVPFGGGR